MTADMAKLRAREHRIISLINCRIHTLIRETITIK